MAVPLRNSAPVAPKASAARISVPALPGSWTPSSTTITVSYTHLTPAEALNALAGHGVAGWTTLLTGGVSVDQADLKQPCGIVIGSEAHGVSEEFRKSLKGITIPTMAVESLNAAVAGAVVLYEAARQRGFQ